ncbi:MULTISPECIES: DUF6452 family protein [Flavobacterium]|uniref:DUF4249 family protein n=1 Tax=Flavobacterium endoglycinae TaxID=2816357 RepID=A0ABX7QFD8_9FLAO|nr:MULTISPECIES: DUF6452 family protein [Flavobacterium]QSW89775.1 hypothetical protein J0383_02910 [Flavobacterium endoglycinae]
MRKIVAFLLLFTFGLSSCEKDDICDANTPTTPRLVIKFFDIADPATPKNVLNLKVVGQGGDANGIVFNKSAAGDAKYLANGNTISIPLKIDADSTTYSFIYNAASTDPTAINTDVITFNYTRQNVYVSRACGFKTIFTLNSRTNPDRNTWDYVLTDGPSGDGLWIQNSLLQTHNIDSENETHLEIYF